MAKKRTSKSPKRKSRVFNRFNVLIGVVVIAIVGIVVIFVSQASVRQTLGPPQRLELYCNQGACATVPFQGARKAEERAYVRLDSSCSSNQSWATKRDKESSKWVCVERVVTNGSTPSGRVPVDNTCFSTILLNGFAVVEPRPQIGGQTNDCIGTVDYGILVDTGQSLGGLSVLPFDNIDNNYTEAANTNKNNLTGLNNTLIFENRNFNIGGKPAIFQIFKNNTSNDRTGYIFVRNELSLNGANLNGLKIVIPYYSQNFGTTQSPIMTSTNLANSSLAYWKWKD